MTDQHEEAPPPTSLDPVCGDRYHDHDPGHKGCPFHPVGDQYRDDDGD